MTHPYGHYPQERAYLVGADTVEPAAGGPADGHRFRITVASAGSYSVEGVPGHTDSHRFDGHRTVEVRAWSLRAALAKAWDLPITVWFRSELDAAEADAAAVGPPDPGNARETRSD